MISEVDFFRELNDQFCKKSPLVAYRDPSHEHGLTRAFLQEDNQLNFSTEFGESGFIFAPFDENKPAIIFPADSSKVIETEYEKPDEAFFYPDVEFSNERAIKEKERHLHLVQKGIDAINSGVARKIVLSRKEVVETGPIDPIDIFQNLLRKYPNAFVYLWYHPEVGLWMGATPETLLQVERNRFKTMALAGTQKFEGAMDVQWGEKEKEEQQIVADTIFENLQKVSGGIERSETYTTRAGNVLHLKTDISGIVEPSSENNNNSLQELISAIHPTPAVCGLPKNEAKKFILANEGYDREFYTGFVGELNLKKEVKRSGNRRNQENQVYGSVTNFSRLFVNLRCMKLEGDRACLFTGGGITKESIPAAEWEETLYKSTIMKAVLLK